MSRLSKAERDKRSVQIVRLFKQDLSQAEIGRRLTCSARVVHCTLIKGGHHTPRLKVPSDASLAARLAAGSGPQNTSTGCVEWIRTRKADGYGRLGVGGKLFHVNRIALAIKLDRELLPSEVCRHTCDNPSCVNPDHLVVGTVADNIRDREDRGRGPSGLTTVEKSKKMQKVLELRSLGWSQQRIADTVGLHQATVSTWLIKETKKCDTT